MKRDLSTFQDAAKVDAGRAAGHIAGGGAIAMPLSAAALAAKERHSALVAALAKRKRARELALPTNDNEVKLELRQLDEPVCVFGEGPPERRERLRDVLAAALAREDAAEPDETGAIGTSVTDALLAARAAAAQLAGAATTPARAEAVAAELFYTEGTPALRAARLEIAADSLRRAATRLATEQAARAAESGGSAAARATSWGVRAAQRAVAQLVGLQPQHSASPDERPLSALALSKPHAPGGRVTLAVGGWGGTVRLVSLPECEPTQPAFRAHTERIGGLAFHPDAAALLERAATAAIARYDGNGDDAHGDACCGDGAADAAGGEGGDRSCSDLVCLATAGGDGIARLWPARPTQTHSLLTPSDVTASEPTRAVNGRSAEHATPLLELRGHTDRLGRCAFHPAGGHLATTSFDGTWRLWDVRTGVELLLQEGHSRAVYCVAFQPDGALVASAGLDALVRVWDCRSGKCARTRRAERPKLAREHATRNTSAARRPRVPSCWHGVPVHPTPPRPSLTSAPIPLAPFLAAGASRRSRATIAPSCRSPPLPTVSPLRRALRITPSVSGTAASAGPSPSSPRTPTSSPPSPLVALPKAGRMQAHGCSRPLSMAPSARGIPLFRSEAT